MSANYTNDALLHFPSIKSCIPSAAYCFISKQGHLIYIPFYITHILLLLPICIFVLYLVLQRQHSTTTSAMTSHSDSFTHHVVTMELLGVVGYSVFCCGVFIDHVKILFVGYCLFSLTWYGEIFFHILTCVERHLAVVHPVTYLSLRGERGIRIRNIGIGCVWLLSFGGTSLLYLEEVSLIVDFCILILSLSVLIFCSLSVLCVLIRSGPDDKGGDRERVDQQKKRAFYTILAILGVLLLRFFWNLFGVVLFSINWRSECVIVVAGLWFNLPSNLVLPLLFLHRAKTLACCGSNKGG